MPGSEGEGPGSAARPLVIAVDGPAAAGKGTLARRLAGRYGLRHLDSGLLYRAVAQRVLRAGGDPGRREAAVAAARAVETQELDDPALREEAVAKAASVVAADPEVRKALIDIQRGFAAVRPGAVIDGRDIGTVVCPDASVKFFLTASLETRAERRLKELRGRGVESIDCRVLQEMRERDLRDSQREASPLVPAEDAFLIDTTDLEPDEVFQVAVSIMEAKTAKRP